MITALLDAPFYTGIARARAVPYPFPVAIGGHPYFIDTDKYERMTIDLLRQAYDQQGEPGDQSLSIEGFWKRTAQDWVHGAAQEHLDDGGERSRFWTSKGIDPWTRREISLLGDTERKLTSANLNLHMARATSGTTEYLFVADGQNVKWTTDPSVTTPSFTTVTGTPAASVTSMTSDGQTIWVAFGASGVYSIPASSPASATLLSSTSTTIVAFANNHLIGTFGNEIFEILASGTKAALFSHYNANFAWACVTGSPTGIFAAGNSSETGQFFFVGYNPDIAQLAIPLPAGRLPDGERIHAITEYGGILALGTSRGLRLAQIVEGRGVGLGPLIVTDSAVSCLEGQDDEMWFGWTNYDTVSTGLGRAKLSRFVEQLVPAHASDLMATAQGIVVAAVTFGDRRYFSVAGSGLWGETANRVASGTIDSGWLNFSTPETKVAANLDVRHAPLNGTITASVLNESGTESDGGVSSVAGSYGPASGWAIGYLRGERFRVQLTLARSATAPTLGPVLRRWTLRAVVVPAQIESFTVPITLYERVDSDISGGHPYPFDPLVEWDYLKSLETSRAPVTYQEGQRAYLVTVRSVGIPQGAIRGWDHKRGFFNATVYVRLVTLESGSN